MPHWLRQWTLTLSEPPSSDFMDMLQHLINCHFIIIIIYWTL